MFHPGPVDGFLPAAIPALVNASPQRPSGFARPLSAVGFRAFRSYFTRRFFGALRFPVTTVSLTVFEGPLATSTGWPVES